MATKQQKLLEDTTAKVSEATSLIGEVADNAKSAVSELEKIASGNSDVLDSNKSVLKKLNFGVILGSLSVLIALGVSAFLFFNSLELLLSLESDLFLFLFNKSCSLFFSVINPNKFSNLLSEEAIFLIKS